jgi:DNA-binding Lrp family transcriptional regulator
MMSVQVFILIQTEVGKASAVATAVSAIAGVTLAEGVTGPYDVIMRAESASMEDLGRSILAKVQAVPGITRTLTCPVTSY